MAGRAVKTTIAAAALLLLVLVPLYVAWQSTGRQTCPYTATPQDTGIGGYSEITLTTPDGINISTWVISPQGERRGLTVVLMHGYTSCKAHPQLLELAKALTLQGARVIMFDFRAHGESGGQRTSIGPLEVIDAKTVVDYASREFPSEKLVLVGFSMGGAVAYVLGAVDERVDAIVADSPYYLLKDVIPRWIGAYTPLPSAYGRLIGLYGSLIVRESLDFGPGLVNPPVNKPVVIIYGDQDPLVKPREMESLAEKSPCGRTYEFKNTGHVEAVKHLGAQGYARIIIDASNLPCPQQTGG